jgi:uncharacterized protein YbjT (DUF2867 family)
LTTNKPEPRPQKILVAGGSGFIGRRLIKKLAADIQYREPQSRAEILCLTRDPESIRDMFDEDIRLVKADVSNYEDLVRVMSEQIDIAYYLVHSMEGTSKQWKKFSERDRVAAKNFAKVATEYGVKRIIYLGGLIHAENDEDADKLSEHMRSRKEVGEILEKHSSSKVTILRAAVILGQGGGSFQMLQYLVERLPVMICPRWVLTKCQPIAVDDVVEYLARCIRVKETEGKRFDIGGPDVLTYINMMRKYAKILNKPVHIIIIPFLTPRLSSYWVDLVTPVRASLARPLIDSLRHDATVQDDNLIRQLIPIQLKSFEEAVLEARNEKAQIKQPNRVIIKERSTQKINSKLLMLSLLAMAAIGSTYYVIDARPEIYHTNWIILSTLWYLGIAFAIYFLRYGARLGALTAGLLGWLTLVFWLMDNLYVVWGTSVIASSPDATITIRNFIGAGVAALVVATSHDLFHKLR